jgi:hypothetical protein
MKGVTMQLLMMVMLVPMVALVVGYFMFDKKPSGKEGFEDIDVSMDEGIKQFKFFVAMAIAILFPLFMIVCSFAITFYLCNRFIKF